jgi:hypothetical protein
VLVVNVDGFIDFENTTTTCPFKPTPVCPLDGVTITTVGAVVSAVAAVVNVVFDEEDVFPAGSCTPDSYTRIVAPPGSGVNGVNVTTEPFTAYVPATTSLFAVEYTWNVLGVTVSALIGAENVATTGVVTATFVALLTGVTLTVGPVFTGVEELDVVNPLVNAVAAFPAKSVNPPTVTAYAVDTARELAGVNSKVVALGIVTVPATAWPFAFTVIAPGPTLTALTGSLKPTSTTAFTGTPPAPFPGLTPTTTGPED